MGLGARRDFQKDPVALPCCKTLFKRGGSWQWYIVSSQSPA